MNADSRAYYNEHDPFAAAWLRELIKAGHIAPGDVDERSIEDVCPADVMGYSQCHFFAGIGVWSYAFRCAGWNDDRPVWTGSCPCQSFSAAGKRTGFADERHLWPAWFHLIRECRPRTIYGEQVASKDALAWFDLVSSDLAGEGYTGWVSDLCAASVGAPHIRQRLYFVADSEDAERRMAGNGYSANGRRRIEEVGGPSSTHILADSVGAGLAGRSEQSARNECEAAERGCGVGVVDNTEREQLRAAGSGSTRDTETALQGSYRQRERVRTDFGQSGPTNGFWRDVEWLPCRDGKARATKPGIFPLAARTPRMLVLVCATCKTETAINEDMRTLWSGPSRFERLWEAEILFGGMLRTCDPNDADRPDEWPLSSTAPLRSKDMQQVQLHREIGETPYQRKPVRQPSREHRNPLLEMSSEAPCEARSELYLRGLWERVSESGTSTKEEDLFCPMCQGVGTHLCSKKVASGSRVGILRGAGNAICAPLATAFIEAHMNYGAAE